MTASAETWGDYEYAVLEDGTVEITDYIGNDSEVEIPAEIDGKIVTVIGEYAFCSCEKLEKIIIPNGVKTIDKYAFYHSFYLEEVILPEGLKTIGEHAFSGCYSLNKVDLPDSVVTLGRYSFGECYGISERRFLL
jgi:hypothetical protein